MTPPARRIEQALWTLPAVHEAPAGEFVGSSPDSPGFACRLSCRAARV
jgi:hypothetical protein